MKKYFSILVFFYLLNNHALTQTLVDFNTIPEEGTIMFFAHQDDDFLWMLPFWNKCEKFICGAYPATYVYESCIQNQQSFLNSNGYGINYEANWEHPWATITHQEFTGFYWYSDTNTNNYLVHDHLRPFWNESDKNKELVEINKIKAKIEPYIADPNTQRIITHNNWGEYGHAHHVILNKAVRELAVKYKKDVWMLGCDIINGIYIDYDLTGKAVTYTLGNFDATLFTGLRGNYLLYNVWTWNTTVVPSGNHPFIKIVDAGVDKTQVLLGYGDITITGPLQSRPGAYIFDGIDDFLTLPGNNYSSFTIGMWVKPDLIKSMDISKMSEYPSNAFCDRSFYMQSDGKVTAQIYDGQSKSVSSLSTLSTGTWNHILMTENGSALTIYFDGVNQGFINTNPVYSGYLTPEFVIGQVQETASFFQGQISDVRIYDYVLTQDEITTLSGSSPPAYYTMSASAGVGGSINPPGDVIRDQGSSLVYTITPAGNYFLSDVKVDGISVGPVTSYTFNNISANHSIQATFTSMASIALNKPAFCSNQAGQYYYRSPLYGNDADGSNNSYWYSHLYEDPVTWWMVDLESNYDISTIVIRNYFDNFNRYFKYEIYASTDNINFSKIADKTDYEYTTDAGDTYTYNLTTKPTARYLKVIFTDANLDKEIYISDFRVYGSPSTSTWKGTTDNNWYNTLNWTGDVPGINKNVIIPSGVSYNPVISADAFCNNLIINTSANLEIASTGKLTVKGTFSNSAGIGGLIIRSDENGTGSIIENSGAAATVQRYIANDWAWHLLSSPVANQDIWQEFVPTPTLNASVYKFPASPWYWDFYYFNPNCPPTGLTWVNIRKNNDGEYNDQSIDLSNSDAGFKDAANTFPPEFEKGRGYLVAYTNGWISGSPETHSFSGFLNTGPISKNIINNPNGSAFNLVGNPYPSSIDWSLPEGATLWGRSGALAISGQGYDYWVWDDSNSGQYLYRNSYSNLGTAGQYIEPGQGFFVKSAGNPTSLKFGHDICTHNTDQGWVKSTSTGITNFQLKLSTDANSFSDEMFIDFNSAYSGKEGTEKFWSFYSDAPEIYSEKEGINYSIDRYQNIDSELTVNVSTKIGVPGNYTIIASDISGFSLSKKVYLKDIKTGTKINLKENKSYSFAGDPNDSPARFKLTFADVLDNNEVEAIEQVYIYSFGKDVYINAIQSNIGNCDVFVYNTLGYMIYQNKYVPSTTNDKLTTLNIPGTYIVKVLSRSGTTSTKIIIL
jgi:hypothetical protein